MLRSVSEQCHSCAQKYNLFTITRSEIQLFHHRRAAIDMQWIQTVRSILFWLVDGKFRKPQHGRAVTKIDLQWAPIESLPHLQITAEREVLPKAN
jgi:hypothetical protein